MRQHDRYLQAGSNYALDYANSIFMQVNNYGAKQDILNARLESLGMLSAERNMEEEKEREDRLKANLLLIAISGAAAAVIIAIALN